MILQQTRSGLAIACGYGRGMDADQHVCRSRSRPRTLRDVQNLRSAVGCKLQHLHAGAFLSATVQAISETKSDMAIAVATRLP